VLPITVLHVICQECGQASKHEVLLCREARAWKQNRPGAVWQVERSTCCARRARMRLVALRRPAGMNALN